MKISAILALLAAIKIQINKLKMLAHELRRKRKERARDGGNNDDDNYREIESGRERERELFPMAFRVYCVFAMRRQERRREASRARRSCVVCVRACVCERMRAIAREKMSLRIVCVFLCRLHTAHMLASDERARERRRQKAQESGRRRTRIYSEFLPIWPARSPCNNTPDSLPCSPCNHFFFDLQPAGSSLRVCAKCA